MIPVPRPYALSGFGVKVGKLAASFILIAATKGELRDPFNNERVGTHAMAIFSICGSKESPSQESRDSTPAE